MTQRDPDIILDDGVFRSLRQAIKAIKRGDYAAADLWTSMLERQIFCIARINGLARRTHTRRPLQPLPPKPVPKLFNKYGREINPIPEADKRRVAELEAQRYAALLVKLGITPRIPKPRGKPSSASPPDPAPSGPPPPEEEQERVAPARAQSAANTHAPREQEREQS